MSSEGGGGSGDGGSGSGGAQSKRLLGSTAAAMKTATAIKVTHQREGLLDVLCAASCCRNLTVGGGALNVSAATAVRARLSPTLTCSFR